MVARGSVPTRTPPSSPAVHGPAPPVPRQRRRTCPRRSGTGHRRSGIGHRRPTAGAVAPVVRTTETGQSRHPPALLGQGGVPLVQIYCVRSLLQSVHRAETFVCTEECAAPAAGTTGLHSPFAPLQDGGAVLTWSAAHGPHHDEPPARRDTAPGPPRFADIPSRRRGR